MKAFNSLEEVEEKIQEIQARISRAASLVSLAHNGFVEPGPTTDREIDALDVSLEMFCNEVLELEDLLKLVKEIRTANAADEPRGADVVPMKRRAAKK